VTMAAKEHYVRIRPRRDQPLTYLATGVTFKAGQWYRLPEKITHPDTGEPFPLIERLRAITTGEDIPVFQIVSYEEAKTIMEAEKDAEHQRLLAQTRAPEALGVADADRPVVPNVKPVEEPEPKAEGRPVEERKGRAR